METAIEHDYRHEWRWLSRVTVVNIHDVRSHGRNAHRWNTSAARYIVRFRYQRMNVTRVHDQVILYSQMLHHCSHILSLPIFIEVSIKVVCYTITFLWVISRTLRHTIVNLAVHFNKQ